MKSKPSLLSILSLLIVYALIRSTRLAAIITAKSTHAIDTSERGLEVLDLLDQPCSDEVDCKCCKDLETERKSLIHQI